VGFRVSRNSVALVKMPVATVCDPVSLDALSAAVPSRAESRVASPRCPARAWVAYLFAELFAELFADLFAYSI